MQPEIIRAVLPPVEIMELLFGRSRSDGFIALGSRRGSRRDPVPFPHWFGVLPVGEQQELFSRFVGVLLDQTKYIGTNTFKRTALRHPPEAYARALAHDQPLYHSFKNDDVFEACAILADLDVGRDNTISAADAVGVTVSRALAGHIPYPSMIGYSGRGAYVLWLLREQIGTAPPVVDFRTKHLFNMITLELHRHLRDLCVDANARRLAQWIKAPGTVDTNTGRDVVYLPFHVNGSVPLHTMEELSEFLDVETADNEITEQPAQIAEQLRDQPAPLRYLQPVSSSRAWTWGRKAEKPERRHRTKHNAAAPLIARYRELELLMAHRRGVPDGARWQTCLHYHSAVWGAYAVAGDSRAAQEQASRQVREFNRRWCKPPMEQARLDKLQRQTKKPRFRAVTICAGLQITREEVELLELRHLLPADVRRERERDTRERREHTKTTRSTKRGVIVAAIRAGRTNAQIKRRYRALFNTRHNTTDVYLHRLRTELDIDDPVGRRARHKHLPLLPAAPAPALRSAPAPEPLEHDPETAAAYLREIRSAISAAPAPDRTVEERRELLRQQAAQLLEQERQQSGDR